MYHLKLWNKAYGNNAKFIVEDSNGKMAEFSPARPKDVSWVNHDLTKEKEYKVWDNFQNEPVQDLNQVIM